MKSVHPFVRGATLLAGLVGLCAAPVAMGQTFSNAGAITIPSGAPGTTLGPATPYPSDIVVSGVTGAVGKVTVTLTGLTHTNPDDLDILLVGPSGATVLLMSDCGGTTDISNVNLTFDQYTGALPNSTVISSGTFRPTNNEVAADAFAAPAPAGPYGNTLKAYNMLDPNGTWSLYVVDDLTGNVGAISGGWSITFLCGIQVTTNADSGAGSLRQAITAANSVGGPDVICFNITSGPTIIQPASPLPAITGTVLIDGLTQPGAAHASWPPTLPIVLDGVNAGAGANGLAIVASDCVVTGLVIQRFSAAGIAIGLGQNNRIQCNFIGTSADGASAAGNGNDGVNIAAAAGNNIIGVDGDGDDDDQERNLISGNADNGVMIAGVLVANNWVSGNYIGTNAAGTAAIPNGHHGVSLSGLTSNDTIGTNGDGASDALEGNVISGNTANGVDFNGVVTNCVVAGNRIGTTADGASALPNGGDGVQLSNNGILAPSNNRIGSNADGAFDVDEGNTIAFNTGNGVNVTGGVANTILRNSIHDNGLLGINLDGSGVTPNDLGPIFPDLDIGANGLQNFPIIDTLDGAGNLTGHLDSLPGVHFRIEFFANAAPDSPSLHGEGHEFLGTITVLTDPAGHANFSTSVTLGLKTFVCATATLIVTQGDANADILGEDEQSRLIETSEFSPNVAGSGGDCSIVCPANISVNNDAGVCGAVVTYTVTTTGSCDGEIINCDHPSGETFPIGTTTVMCCFDDGGSLGTDPARCCSFTVTVIDTETPTLVCSGDVTICNDQGLCSAVVTYTAPQYMDNCPAPQGTTIGCTLASGMAFPIGQTTVTCNATSAAGVVLASCMFVVTVNDCELPTLVCQDATLEAGECGNVEIQQSDIVASFTDNCSLDCPESGVIFTPSVLECPPLNTPIAIAVTGTDCHGNTSTCTAYVTVTGDDCNNNGFDDACDICRGVSLDCNCDWVPDECVCCWDNGRVLIEREAPAPPFGPVNGGVNGELSHEGGGAQDASRVADDVYFCPGQPHKVTAFFGQMITNSFHNAQFDFRHARLDVFEDCDGKPLQTPFKSFTNSQIIACTSLSDGYSLVTYRFDLCDQHLWLDGGKTYWFSLIGLSDNVNNSDLSYWAATTSVPNPEGVIGSVPVRATGTRNPQHWMNFDYAPWESIDDCCLGCVNMAFWLSCEECECIWDNGPADLNPLTKGGTPSGAAGPNEAETADNFVINPCTDRDVCLIQAWVWSNCQLTQEQLDHPCDCAFINIYRNDCNLPALTTPCFFQVRPTRIRALPNTTTIDNRLVHLYCLEFEDDPCDHSRLRLYQGQTYWLSAGIHGNGTIATRSYFAYNDTCNLPCPIRLLPGVTRTITSTGIISDWTRTTHDYAFRILAQPRRAIRLPDDTDQGQPGGGGPPACAVDINHDGAATIGDIFAFLGVWFAGCP